MENIQIVDSSQVLVLEDDKEIKNSIPRLEIVLDPIVIKDIPSEVEVPQYDNPISTLRELCANSPLNLLILDKLLAVFNSDDVKECSSDLFTEGYTTIDTIDELKKYITKLLIRFDTNPKNYTKKDYDYLMTVIYKSLIHLYEVSTVSAITTKWNEPLRDDLVPSEKLTKTTIDLEVLARLSTDLTINERITLEINDRQLADLDLYDDLFPLIAAAL